jgi:hypothetical protein
MTHPGLAQRQLELLGLLLPALFSLARQMMTKPLRPASDTMSAEKNAALSGNAI